jgi:hypothetical protein
VRRWPRRSACRSAIRLPTLLEKGAATPLLLFGAFDRHNFGDLLFPHIAAALLPGRRLLFAGLAARDLTACGGHQVSALAELATEWGERPVEIYHVGGEILTCTAWQAAVMLLPPEEIQGVIARFEHQPEGAREWAHGRLHSAALAPYAVARTLFTHSARITYNAVGGVDLDVCDPALRSEVLTKLAAADAISVRDLRTRAHLEAAGVRAALVPDPAVLVAELFGAKIRCHGIGGEAGQVLAAFPQGYIAVQFSADFGDDATLAEIAAQLDQVVAESGYGVAFFRAGAAPWHDDLDGYRRVAARMRTAAVRIFTSLDIWDICALIAASRAYCGSSLHGRIVAMAYALPRLNLIHPFQVGRLSKQAAYAATWEAAGMPHTITVGTIAHGIRTALVQDAECLQACARELAARYRSGFAAAYDKV